MLRNTWTIPNHKVSKVIYRSYKFSVTGKKAQKVNKKYTHTHRPARSVCPCGAPPCRARSRARGGAPRRPHPRPRPPTCRAARGSPLMTSWTLIARMLAASPYPLGQVILYIHFRTTSTTTSFVGHSSGS